MAHVNLRAKALNTVWRAIQNGELPTLQKAKVPCVDCGAPAIHYDHRDYSKPLDVEPVCQSCNISRGPAIPHICPTGSCPDCEYKRDANLNPRLPQQSCQRCQHRWVSRMDRLPLRCPRCCSIKLQVSKDATGK